MAGAFGVNENGLIRQDCRDPSLSSGMCRQFFLFQQIIYLNAFEVGAEEIRMIEDPVLFYTFIEPVAKSFYIKAAHLKKENDVLTILPLSY